MTCEVEDFNVPDNKKDLIAKRQRKIRDASIDTVSQTVIKAFKKNAAKFIQYDLSSTDMTPAEKIEHVLRTNGMPTQVAHKFEGYSSNTFLLSFGAGVKIGSIYGKRLDIANALNVPSVRMASNLMVYEGKSYMPVEYSKKREKDLLFDPNDLSGLKIPIGRDNFDNVVYWDLENHSTPHALVCGSTGSGKSVLLKSTIAYSLLAGIKNVIVFDPKFEFDSAGFGRDVVVITEPHDIEEQLMNLCDYMDDLGRKRELVMTLVVFDEFADAMGRNKMLEVYFQRLLQKGRSCSIRIMGAMQRASVKVLNGDAKANFPVQICFRVPKDVDSKVVIGEPGAESLAGSGDGLIKSPEYDDIVRFQAYYKP